MKNHFKAANEIIGTWPAWKQSLSEKRHNCNFCGKPADDRITFMFSKTLYSAQICGSCVDKVVDNLINSGEG